MAKLNISAAARAVGKDRGTLHRYIKSGKLSTIRDEAGGVFIEVAELIRVFGPLRTDGRAKGAAESVTASMEDSTAQHMLEVTLEVLKQQLQASQEREAKLLSMLEQEQQSRRELEQRLLPAGRNGGSGQGESGAPSSVIVLGPAQGDIAAPAGVPPSGATQGEPGLEKKGFLARLLGK